ncbi:MAG: carbon monoxide dehydrogenase, partial [Proteobacteria bacterium]|nr:carbon monoxide dehydrogenase [Pseudomonadota bacterium]
LPVTGGPEFSQYLTEGIAEDYKGKWAISPDPATIAPLVVDHVQAKRQALGIHRERERKLFDMKDRRKL